VNLADRLAAYYYTASPGLMVDHGEVLIVTQPAQGVPGVLRLDARTLQRRGSIRFATSATDWFADLTLTVSGPRLILGACKRVGGAARPCPAICGSRPAPSAPEKERMFGESLPPGLKLVG